MRAFQISKDFKRDLKKLPAEIMLSTDESPNDFYQNH